MPIWDEWLHRKHGNMSFHMTQLLTEHGVFYSYLNRIQRVNSDTCPHCRMNVPDTAEHTLKICSVWERERAIMLEKIKMTSDALSLKMMTAVMINSRQEWSTVMTFIEKIMLEKEQYEHQVERREAHENSDLTEIDSEYSN
ncbi:uncharacterized protein LOC112637162 [Camponotus floridanus]|uniref:uncharacterized protein LOC112637162 n=1 Tax=Camponotus floridanus TaxID=104421 RepID=UPI000DC6BC74|nr:uncharacterized protein LOC112637162 [Camponotus floridanus]